MRDRFESAFGNAPIGMALIDMDGRWLQVNDALCRITGHTQDELKATTLAAITHPEDLGLGTVAEFVGDAKAVRLLRDIGVDCAQGYHVGRPRPVAELLQ